MIKKYSSLNSDAQLGFNKKQENKIASQHASKMMNSSWFFMILVILGITIPQKTSVKHPTKLDLTVNYEYYSVILKSSVAEGRGGGGGHGHYDWVRGHPSDACPKEFVIKDFNRNYNSIIT